MLRTALKQVTKTDIRKVEAEDAASEQSVRIRTRPPEQIS